MRLSRERIEKAHRRARELAYGRAEPRNVAELDLALATWERERPEEFRRMIEEIRKEWNEHIEAT